MTHTGDTFHGLSATPTEQRPRNGAYSTHRSENQILIDRRRETKSYCAQQWPKAQEQWKMRRQSEEVLQQWKKQTVGQRGRFCAMAGPCFLHGSEPRIISIHPNPRALFF